MWGRCGKRAGGKGGRSEEEGVNEQGKESRKAARTKGLLWAEEQMGDQGLSYHCLFETPHALFTHTLFTPAG